MLICFFAKDARRHRSVLAPSPFVRLKLLCAMLFSVLTLARAQSADVAAEFARATPGMREGKLDQAGDGFAAVVKQSPGFAEAYFDLGLVRQTQGRYEEAIPSFQKALTLQPRLHGANLFLGTTEFRLNRLDEAATAVQRETVV